MGSGQSDRNWSWEPTLAALISGCRGEHWAPQPPPHQGAIRALTSESSFMLSRFRVEEI